MRASLARWVSDSDALRYLDQFGVIEEPERLAYQQTREDDLYLALVGELFQNMRDGDNQPADWARLGNAFAQYADPDRKAELQAIGVALDDAALFASAAFYFGGFPASAYLTMLRCTVPKNDDALLACFDLLARPGEVTGLCFRPPAWRPGVHAFS